MRQLCKKLRALTPIGFYGNIKYYLAFTFLNELCHTFAYLSPPLSLKMLIQGEKRSSMLKEISKSQQQSNMTNYQQTFE